MKPTAAQQIRAQAKEATRRALLRAGLEETIANKGVLPSIETVSERAGFTRGAFYVHFKNREEFIVEVLDWVIGDIFGVLFATTSGDDADLATIVRRFVDALAAGQWPDVTEIRSAYLGVIDAFRISDRVRERHAELMQAAMARLETALRQGQAAGTVRGDLDPASVSKLLSVLAIGGIIWDGVGLPLNPRQLGESILALLEGPPG